MLQSCSNLAQLNFCLFYLFGCHYLSVIAHGCFVYIDAIVLGLFLFLISPFRVSLRHRLKIRMERKVIVNPGCCGNRTDSHRVENRLALAIGWSTVELNRLDLTFHTLAWQVLIKCQLLRLDWQILCLARLIEWVILECYQRIQLSVVLDWLRLATHMLLDMPFKTALPRPFDRGHARFRRVVDEPVKAANRLNLRQKLLTPLAIEPREALFLLIHLILKSCLFQLRHEAPRLILQLADLWIAGPIQTLRQFWRIKSISWWAHRIRLLLILDIHDLSLLKIGRAFVSFG